MFLSGTILNAVAVAIGATIGLVLAGRFPARIREALTIGIGLFVLVIGMSMALPVFQSPAASAADSLVVLGSVLLGVAVGEAVRLQDGLEALGSWFQRRLASEEGGASRIAEAFVTTSLVFCVGPLTILGSLDNGLRGDATLLATKSVLDGVSSIAFAAALGPGVYLAVATVLVVQGVLSAGAFLLRDVLDAPTVLVLTAVGGTILLGMGLRLLEIKPIRVASFLPALLIAPVLLRVADAIGAAIH